MSTTALQNVWQMLLEYDLSAANKRWLADHLYEQARKEEAQPYTIEELNARIDCAEADIAEGRIISRGEASERMLTFGTLVVNPRLNTVLAAERPRLQKIKTDSD